MIGFLNFHSFTNIPPLPLLILALQLFIWAVPLLIRGIVKLKLKLKLS